MTLTSHCHDQTPHSSPHLYIGTEYNDACSSTYHAKHAPLFLESADTANQSEDEEENTQRHDDGGGNERVEGISQLFVVAVFDVDPDTDKYQSCSSSLGQAMPDKLHENDANTKTIDAFRKCALLCQVSRMRMTGRTSGSFQILRRHQANGCNA